LESADVARNDPDPELFARTVPARLHDCDAFVSHSWHDDAAGKWASVQRWRALFADAHGREPRVWFDKCCIDQRNIEADLRCLPIFLCGCRRLVVFCGPTYLSRLWCVTELFAFVHCGRDMCDITFEPVLREGFEEEDLYLVEQSFDDFDVEQCTCSLPDDKDKILSVIRTAYGDLRRFNRAVTDIFRRTGWRNEMRRRRTQRTESGGWSHRSIGSEPAGGAGSDCGENSGDDSYPHCCSSDGSAVEERAGPDDGCGV